MIKVFSLIPLHTRKDERFESGSLLGSDASRLFRGSPENDPLLSLYYRTRFNEPEDMTTRIRRESGPREDGLAAQERRSRGNRRSGECAQQIHRIVVEQRTAFQPGAERTVEEHAENGGGSRNQD